MSTKFAKVFIDLSICKVVLAKVNRVVVDIEVDLNFQMWPENILVLRPGAIPRSFQYQFGISVNGLHEIPFLLLLF